MEHESSSKDDDKLFIKRKDAQELLNYITNRPFREVYLLVNMLTTLVAVSEPEKPEE